MTVRQQMSPLCQLVALKSQRVGLRQWTLELDCYWPASTGLNLDSDRVVCPLLPHQ